VKRCSSYPVRMTRITWYRPLVWLAGAMAVLAVASVIGAVVDGREVGGVNLWFKPLKFAISVGIYCLSLAWVLELLGEKRRRLARIVGVVSVTGLVIEMVIIVGAAAAGLASHFNVSTPLHAALWSIMAFSIVAVWVMALVVSLALFRTDLGDPARSLAIRAGAVLAVIGMGLAFLMTSPSAQQLADFQGIAGAHAVGVADGGAGLPLLGWSTVAGDLRIPHFVGMHALQVFPLLIVGIELLSRRIGVLRHARVRLNLVAIAIAAYAATIVLLTVQALSAQSIVRPEGGVLVAGVAIAVASIAAVCFVLYRASTSVISGNAVEPARQA